MCVVEREREVLMAGAIRVSGLNGPMGYLVLKYVSQIARTWLWYVRGGWSA